MKIIIFRIFGAISAGIYAESVQSVFGVFLVLSLARFVEYERCSEKTDLRF